MALVFDPDLCAQQWPGEGSGFCQSLACQQVDSPFLVAGNWHFDCVLLQGSFINAINAERPGIFSWDVQRRSNETWARDYMQRYLEERRDEAAAPPLARVRDPEALRREMLPYLLQKK